MKGWLTACNMTSEAHTEPSQTSKMELFTKTVNGFVNSFCKKLHLRCLTGF